MKASLHWIHTFLSSAPSANEVAQALIRSGVEVVSCKNLSEGLENVVVARLEDVSKHPNADRLSLCKVTDGLTAYDIVCGARNMKAGDHVLLAKVGATLPNGMNIKKSKIRGETSEGMLCSAAELDLGEDSDGIVILSSESNIGSSAAEALGRNDWLLELELTPNRGDCLSVIGVAREVAAALDISGKIPAAHGSGPEESKLRVSVQDSLGAPRYVLREIDEIKSRASPAWLKHRLETAGVRSISTVVDATNYVMLEWGQPLHAFDQKKVVGEITVRRAKKGERILCLDEVERKLQEEDLIIADDDGPVAIAGVMGGLRTAVGAETSTILLEAAHFDPRTVRKTSRRLKLFTESSHRFERWVDPEATWAASERALEVFSQVSPGCRSTRSFDCKTKVKPKEKLRLRQSSIKRILGTEIKEAGEYLSRLGLSVEKIENDWSVEIPSRRPDLEREVDLVEEVARLHGYDRFSSTLPAIEKEPAVQSRYEWLSQVRFLCQSAGLAESRSYGFLDEKEAQEFRWESVGEPLILANPVNVGQGIMQQSLLPSLLKAWEINKSRQAKGAAFFEIGTVFGRAGKGKFPACEQIHLGALYAGEIGQQGWFEEYRAPDFYDSKGLGDFLLTRLSQETYQWRMEKISPYLHPGQAASLFLGKKKIGEAGMLHPKIARNRDVGEVAALSLWLEPLMENHSVLPFSFRKLSLYPDARRDLAFIVKNEVTAQQMITAIQTIKDPLLRQVELFDVYEGKGIPAASRSLAFTMTFGSDDRTLQDAEVDASVKQVVDQLKKDCQAKLRA